ncbi:MAG TPA: SDR family NAD(P)-dependent oxidoreductase [Roseiarcus sp.]|nr:SDR family NAD(P)-dependent oxidoreductase [Roseiarcus sp.]
MSAAAIVTGGSSGIGRAAALRLAKAGYDIGIAFRTGQSRAEAVAAEIAAMGRKAAICAQDLMRPSVAADSIDDLSRQLGSIDVFVNNAGVNRRCSFLEETLEDWERIIAINLTGAFACGQRAAKRMVAQGSGGRIIKCHQRS